MPRGPEQQLAQVLHSAHEIPANQIRVVLFQLCGREHVPGNDSLPEAGSESLHLRLHSFRHVEGASVGHVAVGPGSVLPCGRASGIE